MPQYIEDSFNNIPAVKFNFLESAEINNPVTLKTIISINSWDA